MRILIFILLVALSSCGNKIETKKEYKPGQVVHIDGKEYLVTDSRNESSLFCDTCPSVIMDFPSRYYGMSLGYGDIDTTPKVLVADLSKYKFGDWEKTDTSKVVSDFGTRVFNPTDIVFANSLTSDKSITELVFDSVTGLHITVDHKCKGGGCGYHCCGCKGHGIIFDGPINGGSILRRHPKDTTQRRLGGDALGSTTGLEYDTIVVGN